MVALSSGTGKGSGDKDVHPTESPLLRELSADIQDALAHETSMLDVVLASRRRGVINRDAVCCLLTKCLHDVSSAIHAIPYLFALLLGFLFLFAFMLGFKIDQSC
jgi:hypothetical protein